MIQWDKGIPSDILAILKQRFESASYILPYWVTSCYISYNTNPEEGIVMECIPLYPYGTMEIVIYPQFFITEKDETPKHEVIHAHLSPYTQMVEDVINAYIDDVVSKTFILQQLSKKEELITQSLAMGLEEFERKLLTN